MQVPDLKTLIFNVADNIATITLNRPAQANGIDVAMASELRLTARAIAANQQIKAVVLTGEGKLFCAGGDINAMLEFGDRRAEGLKQIADDLHAAMSTFSRMAAPLVVAVNGTAAGAGFSLAVSGDIVIASKAAKFTMAYSKIGLSPDGGASYLLPRLIGIRKTQELMFTNRVLSADEAQSWGLINEVVEAEELNSQANHMANQLAAGARGSHLAIKQLLHTSFANGMETQMELEGIKIAQNAASNDGNEGLKAFIEKRPPKFES